MATETVHPETGADEAEKAWAEFDKADSASAAPDKPDTTAEPVKAEPAEDKAAQAATQTPDATKGTAPAAPEAVDPWANATPEQRIALDAIRADLEREKTDKRRIAGTVSGQQRKINTLEQQLKVIPRGTAEGKPATEPKTDEQWVAFEKDYPELAPVVGSLRKELSAAKTELAGMKSELGGISTDHRTRNLYEQGAYVQQQHPDYDQIAKSPEFEAWYAASPGYVRVGIERNAERIVDGNEVSDLVKKFKVETGWASPAPSAPKDAGKPQPPASDKRSIQMESANTPRSKGPARVNSGLPDPDDAEGSWKYYEELDRRKGLSQ